jgi:hypothetical protein
MRAIRKKTTKSLFHGPFSGWALRAEAQAAAQNRAPAVPVAQRGARLQSFLSALSPFFRLLF